MFDLLFVLLFSFIEESLDSSPLVLHSWRILILNHLKVLSSEMDQAESRLIR
jgi:hypothetical protein